VLGGGKLAYILNPIILLQTSNKIIGSDLRFRNSLSFITKSKMFDLKVINSVLDQMEDERGIGREKMIDAIEQALGTAYKKEFGKRGQIIRAHFDINSGATTFNQIKIVADDTTVRIDDQVDHEAEGDDHRGKEMPEPPATGDDLRVRFDPEKHILVETARLIKKDVAVGDELVFLLESKDDFGRIAAQTAKQVIIQKIREAEKESALKEFGQKEGDIIIGHVQRFERGNLYVDLGRVTGVMPYDEQIPGERFRPGERVRALLIAVDETPRGIFLKLSRSHPDFLAKLFEIEAPELQNGSVEIKAIAREAGSRSKIAVCAHDDHIDPVGSMVGQRGVRVSTVMSELGGEKIDIIEWSQNFTEFIEDSLSPAQVVSVKVITQAGTDGDDTRGHATVTVVPDQQSLAIGRGGQNVRLAAKLTGWKIDIVSSQETNTDTEDEIKSPQK
jgi:N utilization substance protein A